MKEKAYEGDQIERKVTIKSTLADKGSFEYCGDSKHTIRFKRKN